VESRLPTSSLRFLVTEVASSWRHPKRRLNLSEDEIRDHISAMGAFVEKKDLLEMNSFIVENLNTLDRKAQGLLLLNAIVLAIATIVYTNLGKHLVLTEQIVLLVLIAILTASCICVSVLNMAYWTSTTEFRESDAHNDVPPVLHHLLRLRELRTVIIWMCTGAVIICLVSIFLLLLSYTIIQSVT
jgi:hypothetical protein